MSRIRKSFLAFALLIGVGFGTVGFLGGPQPSSRSAAPPRPISAFGVKMRAAALLEESFDLLKEQGKPHSLSAGVRHVYRVDLKAGQFLRVIVQQKGIDVRLRLYDPSNALLLTIDSSNSDEGPEPLLLVAKRAGSHRMTVTTMDKPLPKASYVIEIARVSSATERDIQKASALGAYYQARDLRRNGKSSPQEIEGAFLAAAADLRKTEQRDLQGSAWNDLGNLYMSQGEWEKSIAANQRAEKLFHSLGRKDMEALALHEIGTGEEQLPSIESALKHWKLSRVLAHEVGRPRIEAAALTSLGMFYAERADAWKAGPYLMEAIGLWRRLCNAGGEGKAMSGLGLLYTNLHQNEKAQEIYRSALKIKGLGPTERAMILTQMGNAFIYEGRPNQAFWCFQQAYAVQKGGQDPENEASTLGGFGLTFVAMHDFRNALGPYRQALKIYQGRHDLRNQSILFMNIGWTLGILNRYDEATDAFDRALSLSRRLKNPLLEAGAFLGFAWVERHRGNLSEAQRQGELALKVIESMRSGAGDQEERISFFSGKQDVYDLLINVLMDQYDLRRSQDLLEKSLHISESAHARVLLDVLGKRDRLSSSRAKRVLTVREIQQKILDSRTILLEYSLGKAKSYLWLITQDKCERFVLPDREKVEALATKVYEKLQRSFLPEERVDAIRSARELGRVLLGPVANQLGERRLLIVASGALQSIPFAALPDPMSQSSKSDTYQTWPEPLVLRHEIVYEPSASVLAELRRVRAGRPTAANLLAVLADPVFDWDDPRIPPSHLTRRDTRNPFPGRLRRLLASRREADAISAGLPVRGVLKAIGFDANRELVTSGKLSDYKIIHLATHTFYPSQHPEQAAMMLSRFTAKGQRRDGLLRIKDITSLDCRSDLVVLSSCSSALGKNVLGEGTVGWSHAFLSAGASAVMTSVWDVEDESAADLMQRVYRNILVLHMPPVQALREAQIDLWKDRRHSAPWFWAGFIAQGEWQNPVLSLNKSPAGVSPQDGSSRSY